MRVVAERLRTFSRARDGVAMIEFAIAVPVLLTLLLCGLEAANLVLAHLQISRIASMTADNASRVRDSMDESDVNEIMTGDNLASGTFKLRRNGRVIISDLQRNDAGSGQWIRWQRCYGVGKGLSDLNSSYGNEGDGKSNGNVQGMGPKDRQISATDGTSVMFVEIKYWYTPLLTSVWGPGRQISYTSAYNVRKRPNGDLTDGGGLKAAGKAATC